MEKPGIRIEKDSLGPVEIPKEALYGAQTQRALQNFSISPLTLPVPFLKALALIKSAAAKINAELQLLDLEKALSIQEAAEEIVQGQHLHHFPLDVFQTGSGTSTNMNANEVIAHLASLKSGQTIHPNDDVNMGQSSNDVIPACIHLSVSLEAHTTLLPALQDLRQTLNQRALALQHVVKTGRTHLMDALPLTFGQELGGWEAQIDQILLSLEASLPRLYELTLGGTAIGTGLNAHPEFGRRLCEVLSQRTHLPFVPHSNYFMGISSQDAMVEFSSKVKGLAVTLTKIANDLRLMNSGPLTGFAEISLPPLQPGSSIMPGKINPVIPEAVLMAAAQVMGNDVSMGIAGMSGNFQLNTMLPLIAHLNLFNLQLMSRSATLLATHCIQGFTVQTEHIETQLARNPILVTALNPIIGYEKGALIAKRAYQEQKPIQTIAEEMTELDKKTLSELLDPYALTQGGVKKDS